MSNAELAGSFCAGLLKLAAVVGIYGLEASNTYEGFFKLFVIILLSFGGVITLLDTIKASRQLTERYVKENNLSMED